jgi:serine/threonine-protein kinase HipA
VCHAYRPGSEWVSQHALSINGKRSDINTSDLLQIGEIIKCKSAKSIIKEINQTVQNWREYADKVNVDETLANAIKATHLDMGN